MNKFINKYSVGRYVLSKYQNLFKIQYFDNLLTCVSDGSVEYTPGVTMNFTYRFADDPLGENLFGNITWRIDLNAPAHWTHEEKTCEYYAQYLTTNGVSYSVVI